jgi:hypothetical protein
VSKSKNNKKIQKTPVPKAGSSGIKLTKLKPPEGISFSFKYFNGSHEKFVCADRDSRYWMTLVNRLRDLSGYPALQLRQGNNKTLRCHPIDWNSRGVSEICFGIPGEEQLVDTPYQFSLTSNEHGRVHGFFIENIFFVVWLDPEHQLYAGNPAGN